MTDKIFIRETRKDELLQILAVYPLAFPGEELQPIVSELLGETHVLSLATFQDDVLIGHVLFTIFSSEGEDDIRTGALPGPLWLSGRATCIAALSVA
jgi:hypothetical protein